MCFHSIPHMVNCSICGKYCKNLAGLAGHTQFKHPTIPKRQKINQETRPHQPQQEPYQTQQQQYPFRQNLWPQQQNWPQQNWPQQQDAALEYKNGIIKNLEKEKEEEKEAKERYRDEIKEIERKKRGEEQFRELEKEDEEFQRQFRKRQEYLEKISKPPEPTQLPNISPSIEPKKEEITLTTIADHKEQQESGIGGLRIIYTAGSYTNAALKGIWGEDWLSKKIANIFKNNPSLSLELFQGNLRPIPINILGKIYKIIAVGQIQQILTQPKIDISPLSEVADVQRKDKNFFIELSDTGRIATTNSSRIAPTDPRLKLPKNKKES